MEEPNEMLEHLRAGPEDTPDEATAARREVAEALRALCHAVGASPAAPERLREIAAALRLQGSALAERASATATAPAAGAATIPGMQDFHDRSPIAGLANPLAPPATLGVDRNAGIVVGEVCFGRAFEGAPGIAHGGFVAAVLDEALGMASALSGGPCMTAELTTRYRTHTPIATVLRIEARLDAVDGRKVFTSGEIYAGETRIAEASGVFISVGADKFGALLAARTARAES
jgi:hypothetical protein